MTVVIGLTGSIGMGKTTTAKMFSDLGVPVWSADESVHNLYANGGQAVSEIEKLYPEAVKNGSVDRTVLSAWLGKDPDRFKQVESVVHPLVAEDRANFIGNAIGPIVVVDIPLLFEGQHENSVDVTVVATTSMENQIERVLRRPGMTEAKLEIILSKQMLDSEKRRRADYLVDTSSLEVARRDVQTILEHVGAKFGHA
ncbi:MAG: dephospho-CoA kinase [Boseongicola sp.]|nr:MAG: dephospho-CoA kinase [Boseongicola sp.]